MKTNFSRVAWLILSLPAFVLAQTPAATPNPQQPLGGVPSAQTAPPPAPADSPRASVDQLRPNYVLRTGDQILLRAFEVEEISERPFRIDADGFVDLPVLGRVKAGGSTVEQLEANLVELLKKYVKQPQVTVTVVQFSSETVFFVGAFKTPGIYPLQGSRTLVEMIASVGGLQPTASRRIKVSRRKEYGPIPLPNAVTTPDGTGTTVEVNMASLQNNVNPAEDIVLQPFDVISVERAEMVYVAGEVGRVGGLDLQERSSMSVIQALSLAGGVTPNAKPKAAWILRPISNSSRRAELHLNLDRIMRGEEPDTPLLPNDVLFVPKSSQVFSKSAMGRAALIMIPLGVTIGVAASR